MDGGEKEEKKKKKKTNGQWSTAKRLLSTR
jgi:hypothetical protein